MKTKTFIRPKRKAEYSSENYESNKNTGVHTALDIKSTEKWRLKGLKLLFSKRCASKIWWGVSEVRLKKSSTFSLWKRRKTTSSAIFCATGVWGLKTGRQNLKLTLGVRIYLVFQTETVFIFLRFANRRAVNQVGFSERGARSCSFLSKKVFQPVVA